jgi:hypothetical protein
VGYLRAVLVAHTKQLKLRRCRFQAVHQPQQQDTDARIRCYQGFVVLCHTVSPTTEPGSTPSQDSQLRSAKKSTCSAWTPLHPPNTGVWRSVSARRRMELLLLGETIYGEWYQNFLNQFISLLEGNKSGCRFQHDRATDHNANAARALWWHEFWAWHSATAISRPHSAWLRSHIIYQRKSLFEPSTMPEWN